MRALVFILIAATPVRAEPLQPAAEAFAGAPLAIDPRMAARDCPTGYGFHWADSRAAVIARCGANGPALVLPLKPDRAAITAPGVRRGDRITADIVGDGFRLQIDAVADRVDRDGRVQLRNARSGRAIAATLDADGQLRMAGDPISR